MNTKSCRSETSGRRGSDAPADLIGGAFPCPPPVCPCHFYAPSTYFERNL